MNVLRYMRLIARALDYAKDPDPNHWRTINGSHVHLDKNGNYDGGAGSKFNGRHHYGPDWRQKSALMNRLAASLRGGAAKGQAQGQNVAPKATNGAAKNGTISAEEERRIRENVKKLSEAAKKAHEEYIDTYFNYRGADRASKLQDLKQRKQDALNKEEQARAEATARGVPFISKAWADIERIIPSYRVNSVPVAHHSKQPDESEIIKRISGGDMTKGSCASVGLAYIANKFGLDVLDFRGGQSMTFFSHESNLRLISKLPGIESKDVKVKNPARDGAKVLMDLEKDKEYYLAFERHASIIKNTDEGVMYLELQSNDPSRNCWHLMGDNPKAIASELSRRFKASRTQHRSHGVKYEVSMLLSSVESFKGSKEFEKIAEYFNTNAQSQLKGASGHVR